MLTNLPSSGNLASYGQPVAPAGSRLGPAGRAVAGHACAGSVAGASSEHGSVGGAVYSGGGSSSGHRAAGSVSVSGGAVYGGGAGAGGGGGGGAHATPIEEEPTVLFQPLTMACRPRWSSFDWCRYLAVKHSLDMLLVCVVVLCALQVILRVGGVDDTSCRASRR